MEPNSSREWKLARRTLPFGDRTLVMGILNVTPDSFSDGRRFFSPEDAVRRAEQMLEEGADILDIGGESTRPGASAVDESEESRRVVRVIEAVSKMAGAVISVDTTKAQVARSAVDSGAEIINDISALRFDPTIANVAAETGAGLVLMHSRGTLETMHRLDPVADIMEEVISALGRSTALAEERGVARASIAIDPGIGFSKSQDQNWQLLAELDQISRAFEGLPVVVGTSRKSFIGRLLNRERPDDRVYGTMATVTAAVLSGADIVRVHDVRAAVDTVRVADRIRESRRRATSS
jgi:dihydropteroate synthase